MNRFGALLSVASAIAFAGCGPRGTTPALVPMNQAGGGPASGSASGAAAPESVAGLPDWKRGAVDRGPSGAPFKNGQFQIHIPIEYRYRNAVPEVGMHVWVGPTRADKTNAQLIFSVIKLTGAQAREPVEALFEGAMDGIKQTHQGVVLSPVEVGQIDGAKFMRCIWSGKVPASERNGLAGRTEHGVVYVSIYQGHAIQIACEDTEPDHADALTKGNLVASTFRGQ